MDIEKNRRNWYIMDEIIQLIEEVYNENISDQ